MSALRNRPFDTAHLRCFFRLAAFVSAVTTGLAADEPVKANTTPNEQRSILEIDLKPTQANTSSGSGFTITGTLRNVSSDTTIYLQNTYVVLSVPKELEGPTGGEVDIPANFPTETAEPARIAIEPGGAYPAIWTRNIIWEGNTENEQAKKPGLYRVLKNQTWTEMQFVTFSPGDYNVMAAAKYWTNPQYADPYRTTVKEATLHVATPQSVILFGAAVGGFIAYLILPKARKRLLEEIKDEGKGTVSKSPWLNWGKRVLTELFGAVTACLLSSMVTILLARLAETQFVIRVTVNDVWGAIAIGFVANYAGVEILHKIAGTDKNPEPNKPEGAKSNESPAAAVASKDAENPPASKG